MRITQVEVRTTYHIELSEEDIEKAFKDFEKRNGNRQMFPHAFPDIDTNDTTEENCKKAVSESLVFCGNTHADTSRYIARYFGYDGVTFCLSKIDEKIKMVVYKNGDDLNGGNK